MFFNNFIKRFFSSLLRPWLEQDLELDIIQLGFINSIAIAKNIRLDTAAINRQLIDGSSSARLLFKEFVIEELVLRFSIWSGSAFDFEARGVKATLSLEEMGEEDIVKVQNSSNAALESLKKDLSQIDPEGSALHGILETMLTTTSGRNRFQSSFLNLILQHCCLQILDINLQVQFPTLDDSFVYLLDLEKLNAESLHFVHGCLCRGIVNVFFLPLKEGSFVISGSSFKIGYKRRNQISHVCSSRALVACIKLNDLELVEFNLSAPELSFSFSPVDFSVFMELTKVPSKEFKPIRNGRHLWRLAAIKIGHMILAPKLSWYKLIGLTSLWLQYVNHYEYLLSLIRYSPDHLLEKPDIKIPRDKVSLTSAKHYWEVISGIEKELPAEAIAQARKIARCKAFSSSQQSEDNYAELVVNVHFKTFVQKVMRRIQPIKHLLFWRRSANQDEKFVGYLGNVSGCSYSRFHFILSLGKIYITLSSVSAVQPVNEKVQSDIGISYSDVFSFRFSINVLLLVYIEDIFKQSLSFSCGKLKVKYLFNSVGEETERVKILKIMHGEPAKIFLLSESNKTGTINHAEGGFDPCLENFIGKMCLDWRRACKQFEETEIKCPPSPQLLFEMKSFLRHPDLEKLGSGLWKCNLTVGKFNIVFEHLSMISVVMLLTQTQHALHWTQGNGCPRDLSYSPRNTVHQPEVSWEKKYECYSSKIKMSFMRMLPGKEIQIGVLIAGPHIQFSLRKNGTRNTNEGLNSHDVSGDNFHLGFDIHDIEVVAWPSSKSGLAPIHAFTEQDDEYPECLRLQEPKILDISELENNQYTFKDANSHLFCLKLNGLQAYLEDIVDGEKNQIFILDPVTFRFSSFRQCAHSFSTTSIAFSSGFYWMAVGFTLLLIMDELSACIQALTVLISDLSHLCNNFGSPGNEAFQMLRQDMVSGVTKDEELSIPTPLICNNALVLVNGIFKVKSMDIFICTSRISNEARSSNMVFGATSSTNSAPNYLSDCGIWISLPRICVDLLYEEMKMELVIDVSGIQSVIIRYQEYIRKRFNRSAFRDFLLCSHNCFYEVFLSHCIITLLLSLPQNSPSKTSVNEMLDVSTSEASTSNAVEDTSSSSEQKPSVQSPDFPQSLSFTSNIPVPASSHWVSINIVVGDVFVTRCSVKNILVGAQKINKLLSSLYVGAKSQKIAWGIQGGFLCLETNALAMFIRCSTSYLHHINKLSSIVQSTARYLQGPRLDDHLVGEHAQEMPLTSQQVRWELPKAFNFDVSQFSLALIFESEPNHIREFVLELDLILNLDSDNMQRKFMFKLSRLSIFSQIIQPTGEDEIPILHSSSAHSNISSQLLSGESSVAFQNEDGSFLVDDSYSRASVSEGLYCLRNQDYILKHLTASLSAEKADINPLSPERVWVGSGSVSGFDMKISLSELEMILSMVSSFSGLSVNGSSGEFVQRNWSYNPQDDNNFDARIPDGAIVAVQDVHQHLYFTVEGGENKFAIGGAVHYSFVGERALFRVKYHKQRKWKSSVLWFSLISLHAKDNSGEPLRLNSNPGSGFVELSSTSDNAWSLWRVIFCEPTYEGDIDWESYNHVLRNTFYLVNKKNDCAVAFNDRVPVFVKKPGNPFKFKVLSDKSVAQEVVTYNMYSMDSSGTKINLGAHEDRSRSYWQSGNLPSIGISIDKVSLTIFHELSDSNERFPLLHACIFDTQLTLQILSTKVRVISTSQALLQYFDAQANFWRDFLHPVEICIFYRSSFQNSHGVPVHVYCRIKELEISLTELSMDILLFVIGKLNLAGPFSLRSAMILSNCCKVENKTGLNLLCHLYGKLSVTVGRKQSASFFLRLSAIANQPPDTEPVVSIQLSVPGSFTTSPVHLSLLGAQALAWRTRILSLQDSKSYPGPFIVVDISRKQEDGVSIAISPLIRIQNETKLAIELRIRRPEQMEEEFASVSLKAGDTFDDSMASFDAINLSGGLRKALMSLNVGNFLFSFRPEMSDDLIRSDTPLSVEWSDEIKGGKAIRLSGIFDKLSYEVRKVLSVGSVKCSFSTTYCTIKSAAAPVSDMHFLIQSIGREVPIMKPDKSKDGLENRNAPISLQEQKEIFILPTVRVSNLLHSEIHVLLTETNTSTRYDNIGKEATLPCRSTVDFYANPAIIFFFVSLTAFSSTSKPVNSGEWANKLLKHKNGVRCLDIDLDFCGGKYFASLRLSRGYKGILEATVYTRYTLKNDTDFSLFFFASGQKPSLRNEMGSISPEFGLFLPPKSTGSWFLRSCKMYLRLLENPESEAQFDLNALSGPTELGLEIEERSGVKYIAKFGVSIKPSLSTAVPSETITIASRHVVMNESESNISVCQCNLEVDMAGVISINSRQSAALLLQNVAEKRTEYSLFENFIKKHRNDVDSSLIYIQFRLNESQLDWSGPLCITSLGRFFLKFRKQPNQLTVEDKKIAEFAEVHVAEEGSTIVVRFQKPPNSKLPYRIENCLHGESLTYYQKNSSESEFLGSDCFVDYTWDDVTLPHKLVVIVHDMNLPREINLDKVRTWKPFYKVTQERLASHLHFDRKSKGKGSRFGELHSINAVRVGYEVYADGPTRVLRICEFSDTHKQDKTFHSCAKIRMRVSQLATQLLEKVKEDLNRSGTLGYTPFAVARLQNISLESLLTDQQKYNQIAVQSLAVDVKWAGAPVASMLRRHQFDYSDANDSMLKIVFVLLSAGSDVKQVKYSSLVLQPIDLNVDEDTLMKMVSFWRTSLSNSNSSQQFYFDHFEIHPIKIIATFIPGESYSSYNSTQEALRTLLHSVVKVPPIKKVAVELNGVSVTHALVTTRELLIRCAQHYSWYAMRSISIAKGSQLLPPGFASMFDDFASSSLDVFFDPSQSLMNIPGFKLGTFKFISRCINGKGFSGTKRYFGDLGKTLKTAGSNVIFAAVTEVSDSVLKGAEASGFNGMVSGFHQGILKLAMEPSVLGTALMGGGPDRKIKLDRSAGVDELYIEGYLQAMLDSMYRQEYLRVRVIDDQVFLKNLPPNSSLINEIMDRVKGFLISKALLKGDPSAASRSLRNVQGESEWGIGTTIITLCEHLFVSFTIRKLRSQADKYITIIRSKKGPENDDVKAIEPADTGEVQKVKFIWKWGIAKFVLSGILAYIDGRLCRNIPNPVARRIVSGFLLSFLDQNSGK